MDKKKILVVEDEFVTQSDIQDAVEEMGFEVPGTADTGEGAVKMAGELKPDLILMDINLKDKMTGITAAGIIKERYKIPVVFLTGQSDDATIAHALESDPFGYVLKPFKHKELKTSIAVAFYKHAMEEKLHQKDATINALLNATKDETVLVDNEGKILALNDAFARYAKKPAGELVDTVIYELIRTGGISMKTADEMQKKGTQSPVSFEEESSGRWLDTTIYSINDSSGNRERVAIFRHDITALKQAEHKLNALNEQLVKEQDRLSIFTAALDNMSDCAIITNHVGEIIYVNSIFEKKFGRSSDDVKGKEVIDLAHAENRLNLSKSFFLGYKESHWQGVFLARNTYGVKLPMTVTGRPIKYYQNRPTHFVLVMREMM